MTKRRALASVFFDDSGQPFVVAETPGEVIEKIRAARGRQQRYVELTLANASSWNGRPVFIEAAYVRAVSPPMSVDDEGDDD